MAYTKYTWQTGEVITAGRLNNIEDGIADAVNGGMMVVNDTDGTLDKTWQEIYDAMAQGKLCVKKFDTGDLESGISVDLISPIFVENGKYKVRIDVSEYSATTANGYPSISASGGVS